MYVTRAHYQRVVAALGLAVVVLGALLGIIFFSSNEVNVGNDNIRTSVDGVGVQDSTNTPSRQYLQKEEGVVVSSSHEKGGEQEVSNDVVLPFTKVLFQYVEVTEGCGPHYVGECVNVRSGPGTDFPVVQRLRNNVILKIDGLVERQGYTWYRIIFDEWLRYPERVEGDWYIASDYVRVLLNEGEKTVWEDGQATTSKRIVVDRSDQRLFAYDGDELFMETPISTGLSLTPTPAGEFTIFKKTPSRYMQGPVPGIPDKANDAYDLPGVPWNLYFTEEGAVIHGAYWHESFGRPYSHGCVNLHPEVAQELYQWAVLGTKVIVRE